MTREERIHEIANAVDTIIGKEIDGDYICNDEYDFTIGFECGAKWENKVMLDKACKWIQCNVSEFVDGYSFNIHIHNLIKKFREAMEEGV